MREMLGTALLLAAGLIGLGSALPTFFPKARRNKELHPSWASDNCVPMRQLSRRDLLSLAAQGRLLLFLGLTSALLLYLCAMEAYRVLSPGQTVASCAVLCAIMFFPALIFYRNSLLPLRSLIRHSEHRQISAGWVFRYVKGAWQYADTEWFVRVGGGESCALRACELDFAALARYATVPSFTAGARFPSPSFAPSLLLRRRDGKKQIARIDVSDDLILWITGHGGIIS